MAMPATAEIPGQEASAFQDAVAAWLAEDEGTALTDLAALAQGGNAAARILLALIDKTPALQGPWLSHQSRDARLELMRAPGGMSGRSWMTAAAAQVPVAGLWLQLWRVDAPIDLPLAFARADEPRAAREALVALAVRERRGFAGIADAPGYPDSLRFLVWREWLEDPDTAARVRTELALIPPGDPQRARIGTPPAPGALAEWLLSAPESAAIAALCTTRCPAAPGDCALAAHDALASHRALLVFGSPSEALIPSDVFHASPKGQSSLLRRILLAVDARGRRAQLARAEARDSCLADLLQSEAQRYIPRRD
ncbi:hypothetical protein CCR87_13455 [Rhodobaculum claviforme]|uniref:Uncharacterized protein n=2 Tax=Rhodobaculum claviforme TaxID=1549854 RepID=A0A934TM05_9RHOB|nr:hypothetical protein [Rhodobaculum claviforme]